MADPSCSPKGGRVTPWCWRDVTDLQACRRVYSVAATRRYYSVSESNALPQTVTQLPRPRTLHQKAIRWDGAERKRPKLWITACNSIKAREKSTRERERERVLCSIWWLAKSSLVALLFMQSHKRDFLFFIFSAVNISQNGVFSSQLPLFHQALFLPVNVLFRSLCSLIISSIDSLWCEDTVLLILQNYLL